MTGSPHPVRPSLADLEKRKGRAFRVSANGGIDCGSWILSGIRPLVAPDMEGLRELECLSLTFRTEEPHGCVQGTYRLTDQDGYVVDVFAVPASQTEMAVTIN